VIDFHAPGPEDARRLWRSLAAQLGAELPDGLADRLASIYTGASGRDIKELLKLTSKYSRRKGIALSEAAFAQCAVFRGLAGRGAAS